MDLEQLTEHLFNVHKRVIDVMTPVIEILPPPPIKVIVRPLLVGACIPADGSKIYVSSRDEGDGSYNQEKITRKEFDIAHETGHYLHLQNCKIFEGDSEKDRLWKGTMRGNRRINYNELTAEFFACLYLDLEKGTIYLSTECLKIDPEMLEFYFSANSIDKRKEIIRWLISHNYDQAKRSYKKGPLNKDFRRLVMDDWKV